MLCLMDTFVPLKEKIMKDLMIALATELDMVSASLRVNSIGLYSSGTQAYPTPRGIHIKYPNKPDVFVDCLIAKGKLMRLMSSPEMLREDIRVQATQILNTVTNQLHVDVKFKIEGERLIVITKNGKYRINVLTHNVTILDDNRWVIIDTPEYMYDRIAKLNGTLIQVGLM